MSIDRGLQVGGTVIGLVGGGILLLYPHAKWAGWGSIGLGVLILLMSGAFALGARHALKEQKQKALVPTPTQSLTQHAPVTNTNNPIFAPVFAPHFLQSQSQQQTANLREQKPSTREPVFEIRGTPIPRYGFNTQTGELIRESYQVDPSEIPDHFKFVDVLLAKILYRPDPGVDPRLRVNAHVFFYDADLKNSQSLQTAALDVYAPIWNNDEPHVSMEFSAGYTHDLILALVPAVENPTGIIGYEYGTRKVPTYSGSDQVFYPKTHNVEGSRFAIKVELIPKLWNDIRCTLPPFWFGLSLSPKLEFKPAYRLGSR